MSLTATAARLWNRRPSARGKKPGKRRPRRAWIEPLETKDLLNADWNCETAGCGRCGGVLCACGIPQLNQTTALTQQLNAVAVTSSGPSAATYPLTNIPNLHSRAGATAKLYLDFNGHFEASWGSYSNVSTPVFDFDGNASTFSDSELATIQEIWQRVAEDFAPFNIDVTTQDPGNFSNGVGLRISIGGNGSWYGAAGGVAYVNSFTNSVVNTAYVFTANLGNGNARYTAEAVSHEAGHAFGLMHQSVYDAQGNMTAAYSQGTADWAPIMGVGYYSARSTWANGPTTSVNTLQDNLAVLSGALNGFGYAADDHGDTGGAATALTVNGANATGAGLIGQMSDLDYFSFSTLAGSVSFTVSVLNVGANLDAKVELRSASGTLIAAADPGNSLSATITASVSAGSYYLIVSSHGTYGDLGTYTITGTVQAVPDTTPPTAQADTATTVKNSSVAINVTANDSDVGGTLNKGSVQIVGNAGHGTVTVNTSTGVVTYTPHAGYVGSDSFQYIVRDAAGNASNVATVTITVTAPPPVVQNNTPPPPKTTTNQVKSKVAPKVTIKYVTQVVTKVVTTMVTRTVNKVMNVKVNGQIVKKMVKVVEKVPVKTIVKTLVKVPVKTVAKR